VRPTGCRMHICSDLIGDPLNHEIKPWQTMARTFGVFRIFQIYMIYIPGKPKTQNFLVIMGKSHLDPKKKGLFDLSR